MAQSIGDFAMDLIAKDLQKKGIEPIREQVTPGKDLSQVKLSDNTYDLIMEQSFGIKVEKKLQPVTKPTQVLTESKELVQPVKKTPDQLLAEFTEIIVKARGLLVEMTTCGMIGTGPGKKMIKKKRKFSRKY